METLITALYPIGSEEEDEIHGFVSQMWIESLDPEIMALPSVGIHKSIRRRLKEAHKQEIGFWTAVLLAATKEVRQTRLAYHKATRREAEKRRKTPPSPQRSPQRSEVPLTQNT